MGDISDQMLKGIEQLPGSLGHDEMGRIILNRIGKERTIHSARIQQLLTNDPNAELNRMIEEYFTQVNGAKLSIEDLKSYLELSVHDADGQIATTFGISTNSNDPTTETVSEETYNGLKELAINPDEAEAKVKADLDTRKIY